MAKNHKLLNRAEAERRGLKRYFTGKPCLYGHIAERLTSNMRCYECCKISCQDWRKRNAKYINERNKEYIERNPQFADYLKEYKRKWYKRNLERILTKRKINYKRNKRRIKAYLKRNAIRIRAQRSAYDRERRKQDFLYRLIMNMRNTIKKVLDGRKPKERTFAILGYSPQRLLAHLKKYFLPGMTLSNYGNGKGKWNVEHTRPLASFNVDDFVSPEAMIRKAFALRNLRPMWHDDNLKKGSIWNGYRWKDGVKVAAVER